MENLNILIRLFVLIGMLGIVYYLLKPNTCLNSDCYDTDRIIPNYDTGRTPPKNDNCKPGYSGDNCEISVCSTSDLVCENGGTKTVVNGECVCSCRRGFTGAKCENKQLRTFEPTPEMRKEHFVVASDKPNIIKLGQFNKAVNIKYLEFVADVATAGNRTKCPDIVYSFGIFRGEDPSKNQPTDKWLAGREIFPQYSNDKGKYKNIKATIDAISAEIKPNDKLYLLISAPKQNNYNCGIYVKNIKFKYL
jgi:hypothetical protein